MATARKRTKRRNPTSHTGIVSEWDVYVSASGANRRNMPARLGMFGIDLRGELLTGLDGVKAFDLTLAKRPVDELTIDDSVGSVLGLKPCIRALVNLTPDEYESALALTTSGKTVHLHLSVEKPHYGSAPIRSFSMSSKEIE